LETSENEVKQRSRTLVKEMNEHTINIEAAVKDIEQNVAQTKENVESMVESIASDVKEISAAILVDKQNKATEIQKLNSAINRIRQRSLVVPLHATIHSSEMKV
jgi:HAMP domain-containing protein